MPIDELLIVDSKAKIYSTIVIIFIYAHTNYQKKIAKYNVVNFIKSVQSKS